MSRIVCLDCLERQDIDAKMIREQMLLFLNDCSGDELTSAALERLEYGGDATLGAIILDIMKERLSGTADGSPPTGE